jgi:hypothetical protein
VFAGWIVGGTLERTNRALAGHSALELTSDFLRAALFQWISASPNDERARANDRQGLHLFILRNEGGNANRELSEC